MLIQLQDGDPEGLSLFLLSKDIKLLLKKRGRLVKEGITINLENLKFHKNLNTNRLKI